MIKHIKNKIKKNVAHIIPTLHSKRVAKWYLLDKDLTLRYNYPLLNEDSVVVDLGGYKGQFASDIFSQYQCSIFVFEPVLKFYDTIEKRFSLNKKIKVFPVALANATKEISISLEGDSTSFFKENGQTEIIKAEEFCSFMDSQGISNIDLLKLNIEGAEYDLLDYIIEKNWACRIKNIQVQFHDFIPNADSRMKFIQQSLSKTHHTTYQVEYVWENWEINS